MFTIEQVELKLENTTTLVWGVKYNAYNMYMAYFVLMDDAIRWVVDREKEAEQAEKKNQNTEGEIE